MKAIMIGLLVAVASPAAAQYIYVEPPDPETQFYDRELKRMQYEDELRKRMDEEQKEARAMAAAMQYIREHPRDDCKLHLPFVGCLYHSSPSR
jgi:hypothetical protein